MERDVYKNRKIAAGSLTAPQLKLGATKQSNRRDRQTDQPILLKAVQRMYRW